MARVGHLWPTDARALTIGVRAPPTTPACARPRALGYRLQSSKRAGTLSLVVVATALTDFSHLLRFGRSGGVLSASFSADGRWIAWQPSGTGCEPDVFVMPLAGGARRPVTGTPQ